MGRGGFNTLTELVERVPRDLDGHVTCEFRMAVFHLLEHGGYRVWLPAVARVLLPGVVRTAGGEVRLEPPECGGAGNEQGPGIPLRGTGVRTGLELGLLDVCEQLRVEVSVTQHSTEDVAARLLPVGPEGLVAVEQLGSEHVDVRVPLHHGVDVAPYGDCAAWGEVLGG